MNHENPWPPLWDAWARTWMDWLTKNMPGGGLPPSGPSGPDPASQVRAAAMGAWNQWWDQWARSPEFLDGLKRSVDSAVQARRCLDDLLAGAQAAGRQAAGEEGGKPRRAILRGQRRIARRVDRLNERLDQLDARLAAIEARLATPETKPQPRRKPSAGKSRKQDGRPTRTAPRSKRSEPSR